MISWWYSKNKIIFDQYNPKLLKVIMTELFDLQYIQQFLFNFCMISIFILLYQSKFFSFNIIFAFKARDICQKCFHNL